MRDFSVSHLDVSVGLLATWLVCPRVRGPREQIIEKMLKREAIVFKNISEMIHNPLPYALGHRDQFWHSEGGC